MNHSATIPLSCVELEPIKPAKASVIWLHGLGADGHNFEPIVPELCLPEGLAVRFVFPHAPYRAVTVNQGMSMRAWYDIFGFESTTHQDRPGIMEAASSINALIEQEKQRGIPENRIVLAGFSQGGAMALHCGLRYPKKLAGILALSCYIPIADTLEAERSVANQKTPIFLAHGTEDDVVPIDWAYLAKRTLEQLHYTVNWHEYPMRHAVSPSETRDISTWLKACLE